MASKGFLAISKANSDYHDHLIDKSKRNFGEVLQDSMHNRHDFINELENRINSIKNQEVTPTFQNITKEDIKSFNFDKELDRLKKTLSDIKDQECRFIKLLHRQTPEKMAELKTPVKSPKDNEVDYNIANTESDFHNEDHITEVRFKSSEMNTMPREVLHFETNTTESPTEHQNLMTETSPVVTYAQKQSHTKSMKNLGKLFL